MCKNRCLKGHPGEIRLGHMGPHQARMADEEEQQARRHSFYQACGARRDAGGRDGHELGKEVGSEGGGGWGALFGTQMLARPDGTDGPDGNKGSLREVIRDKSLRAQSYVNIDMIAPKTSGHNLPSPPVLGTSPMHVPIWMFSWTGVQQHSLKAQMIYLKLAMSETHSRMYAEVLTIALGGAAAALPAPASAASTESPP